MSRIAGCALLALALLAGCSSGPAPVPSPTPTPTPSAVPSATGRGVTLDGDDLGVTRVGADFRAAVGAVSAVLGPPTADLATDVVCVASEDEVAWGDLRLASSGGKLAGWLNQRTDLGTDKGITVGSTVADVLAAYGDTVVLRAGTSDAGPSFADDKAGLAGGITTEKPDGTVIYLYDGVCAPP